MEMKTRVKTSKTAMNDFSSKLPIISGAFFIDILIISIVNA